MKPISTSFAGISLTLLLLILHAPIATAYTYKKREISVRTTAYTHTESDHLEYGKQSALGTPLKFTKEYSSAASDWSHFPVGTEFRIKGLNRHFVIDDYGSALVGKDTIDIYFPSKTKMNRWGVQHVDIIITKYGDYDKSLEILEQRKKYSHCRKMLTEIKKNGNETQSEQYEAVPDLTTETDPTLMAAASIPKGDWSAPAPDVVPDPRQPFQSKENELIVAKTKPVLKIRRGIRSFREIFASNFQTVGHFTPKDTSRVEISVPIDHQAEKFIPKPSNIRTNKGGSYRYQSTRKKRIFRPIQ